MSFLSFSTYPVPGTDPGFDHYQDVVSTQRAIEQYSNADPSFPSTREAKFLVALVEAFDSGDAETYTGAVAEYDR